MGALPQLPYQQHRTLVMLSLSSLWLLLLLSSATLGLGLHADSYDPQLTLSKIAFGSCNRHDMEQSMWNTIAAFKPDIWVWLGDVVYADTQKYPAYWVPSPLQIMQEIYDVQKNSKPYKALLSQCPVIGVWDDHDYGKNDGGNEYSQRVESKEVFLNFLDEPKDSVRYQRQGVYASYSFGPPSKKVKIILLDTRYFREEQYGDGDILGTEQWDWLEKQLNQSDAQIHLIGSGVQVLPSDKAAVEKWGCHPNSRKKLLELISATNAPGILLLSGDVHHGEILCDDCSLLKYPLYETTSSGITHACGNQLRWFGIDLCSLVLSTILKSKYQLGFVTHLNFGAIEIDWEKNPIQIWLKLRDSNGIVQLEKEVSYLDLLPNKNRSNVRPCEHEVAIWRLWPKSAWLKLLPLLGGLSALVLLGLCCFFRKLKTQTTNHISKVQKCE